MIKIFSEYVEYIKKKNLSKNTIAAYEIDLKKYLKFIEELKLELNQISENDIFSFLVKLENNSNVSSATLSRIISTIRSFHEYLFLNRITENDPSKNIKKPKVERKIEEILTKDEVDKILESPNDTVCGVRDKAILEVIYGTGIRVSELVSLNLDDLNLEYDYLQFKNLKTSRIIPIGECAKKYLQLYIQNSRNVLEKRNQEALFLNATGERFSRQGIWKLIKKYAKENGIKKNVTPNMLRTSFAIHLLEKGANAKVVNQILGNSNLSSLQGYMDFCKKNIRQEFKDKHPRG